eukprot:7635375-Pyramimonas_sp.AAC.1
MAGVAIHFHIHSGKRTEENALLSSHRAMCISMPGAASWQAHLLRLVRVHHGVAHHSRDSWWALP